MKRNSGRVMMSRALAGVGLGLAMLVVALIGLGLAPAEESLAASVSGKKAHVVVQKGFADSLIEEIDFAGDISGLKALELTGLDVITYDAGWGVSVCSIEGVGCPEDECYSCAASEGGTRFWNYSYWDGSAWQGYAVGPSDSVISNAGSVEGWAWGTWPTEPEFVGTEKLGYVAVQEGPMQGLRRSFTFDNEVSGLEALYLTGLDVITYDAGWGVSVCSIEGVGCPQDECYSCAASEGGTRFWNYSYWDGSAWQGYAVGPSDSVISNAGSVEGWAWGTWPTDPEFAGKNKLASVVVQTSTVQNPTVNSVSFLDDVSGLDALLMTGMDVITYDAGWGISVCSVGGVGCSADECYSCPASEGGTRFWNYRFWDGSSWQGYEMGPSDSIVSQPGAIDGWAWGEWGTAPIIHGKMEMAVYLPWVDFGY